TVPLTDDNGCTVAKSATITQPASAVSASDSHVIMLCFPGTTLFPYTTLFRSVGPYTFSWADGPTTEDRTGLAAGTYTVTLTDHKIGRAHVRTTVTVRARVPSAAGKQKNVLCFGGSTGSINITPSGGVGPYTFS